MDDGWDITVDRLWSAGFVWEQQALEPSLRIPPYMIPQKRPLSEWIRQNRIEAIISKAEFVLPTLKEMGMIVPRDMAFVDVFLEDGSGRIAGIRQNHERVGAAAVELLSSQIRHNIRGVPEIPIRTLVEGTWVDGESLPAKRSEPRRSASR
jgi:LacI family transcriptional regulator